MLADPKKIDKKTQKPPGSVSGLEKNGTTSLACMVFRTADLQQHGTCLVSDQKLSNYDPLVRQKCRISPHNIVLYHGQTTFYIYKYLARTFFSVFLNYLLKCSRKKALFVVLLCAKRSWGRILISQHFCHTGATLNFIQSPAINAKP